MVEAAKEEGVDVARFVGSRNDKGRENVLPLVPECGVKVVNNPSVELKVTLESLTAYDATETTPAPGQSSIAEDPPGAIIDEFSNRMSTPEPLSESVGADLTAMRAHLSISDKWKELGSYARKVLGIATVVSEVSRVSWYRVRSVGDHLPSAASCSENYLWCPQYRRRCE